LRKSKPTYVLSSCLLPSSAEVYRNGERERDLGKEERGWKKQQAAKQEPRKEGRSKPLRFVFEGK
jgi:hypothetical protein